MVSELDPDVTYLPLSSFLPALGNHRFTTASQDIQIREASQAHASTLELILFGRYDSVD
jgi:hypothetical protein